MPVRQPRGPTPPLLALALGICCVWRQLLPATSAVTSAAAAGRECGRVNVKCGALAPPEPGCGNGVCVRCGSVGADRHPRRLAVAQGQHLIPRAYPRRAAVKRIERGGQYGGASQLPAVLGCVNLARCAKPAKLQPHIVRKGRDIDHQLAFAILLRLLLALLVVHWKWRAKDASKPAGTAISALEL